ncbi:integrase core domain-containing protein, partial [Gluconobacter kondonii]|uniref:integrase core domain-containing protein n=1 Tax=Gluconobacter kondonii TaxID=941463 RepID=UPI00197CDC9D
MGQIRHGSATTTHAVRAAIQRSQASLAALSKEFGINPKTVAKWRKRQTVEDQKTAWEFLEHLLSIIPYRIHTILTDNGIQFADQPRNRNTAWSRPMRFDMICEAHGIEHRLTKPNHPWTNGQVERMNRTIKEATVKRFHYDSHEQLRTHLNDFMAAYNFGRRLKTL